MEDIEKPTEKQLQLTAVELIHSLEEVALSFLPNSEVDHDTDFIIGFEFGAKWQEEQAKAMEKEAVTIIRKFVNEFDEEGEVSWNTRDEAENFLNNL